MSILITNETDYVEISYSDGGSRKFNKNDAVYRRAKDDKIIIEDNLGKIKILRPQEVSAVNDIVNSVNTISPGTFDVLAEALERNNFFFSSTGYVSQYQSVYDSFTTKPSAAVATAQNTMVGSIVSANIWTKLDQFVVYAAHTNAASEALVNWVAPGTRDHTLVGTPAFVAFEGFTGSTDNYIRTNWIASTHGVNYTQDSASYGAYSRTNVNGDYRLGAHGNVRNYMMFRSSDKMYGNVNSSTSTPGYIHTDSRGMFIASRTGSAVIKLYINGSEVANETTASSALINIEMYVLAFNNSGTAANFDLHQVAFYFAGSGLTGTDVTNLTNAFETYMDSNSKGVIT
jgi:hypothetical protein